jgi:hypothetical protein
MPDRGKQDWRRTKGFRMTPEKWNVVRILSRAYLDALDAAGPLPPLVVESIERAAPDLADSFGIPTDVFWDAVHGAS